MLLIICLTAGLAPIATKREMMNPKLTASRSLADTFKALFKLEVPCFLSPHEISLPARIPRKHHVVLIGILDNYLKTKRTIEYKRSIKVA